jgi:L-ribulokinase
MTGVKDRMFRPIPQNVAVYKELYGVYQTLHDAFGLPGAAPLNQVMKDLLKIKAKSLIV